MAYQTKEKHPKLKSKVESKITKAFGPVQVFKKKDGTVVGDRRPMAVAVTDRNGVIYARDSHGVIKRMSLKNSKRRRRVEERMQRLAEHERRVWARRAEKAEGAA